MIGALDSVLNPAAARARKELEEQNERVVPIPSPGDNLLAEGKLVIRRPPPKKRLPDEQPSKIHLKTD
jgi:hypothetical protein